jgi:type II secretion system protein I
MTGHRSRYGEAGFTLLETLVALAILGVVMSTVYAVIGSGLRTAHRDEDRLLLGLVAQNLLARSHYDLNPREGALSGDIGGGLRWRIESEPYAVPEGLLLEAPQEFDEPGLRPDEADGAAGADGTRSAGFGERGPGALGERESSDRRETGLGTPTSASPADDDEDDRRAGERERPRPPLRLRLVRVSVEKGDQRYQLSTLAMEPPIASPRAP